MIAPDDEDDKPFSYYDTAASRAEIVAVINKLRLRAIAILGLGGTALFRL